jgi:hypothetical protein
MFLSIRNNTACDRPDDIISAKAGIRFICGLGNKERKIN